MPNTSDETKAAIRVPVGPGAVLLAPGSLPGRLDLTAMFGRSGRVEVELGFGKGSFLVDSARACPERDFLGVEQVRSLARKLRDRAVREGLGNVRLLHANAKDVVGRLLPEASVARVHVYYPDPWPKRRHAKHRLFTAPFPDHLARILRPGGELFLATDHDPYFREVLARLHAHPAFVRTLPDAMRGLPSTGFERIFGGQGIPIFRACWQRVIGGPERGA